MAKCLVYYLVFGLSFTSCTSENSTVFQNPQPSKTIIQDERKPSPDEAKLSKEVFILIGRGGCCSGHIISINKNGEVKYFVGNYSIPNDKEELPEIYDPQQIKPHSNYKPKNFKLSPEKINSLERVIRDEQKLHFREDLRVIDDYVYTIYLDNKKIASGQESRKDKFPENLKALIDFIHQEVKMYELPGMA